MPHRPLRLLLVAATAVATAAGVPAAVADHPPTAPAGTVGIDPAGDWGSAVHAQSAPVGDALAQDLRSARIVPTPDGQGLTFVIGVTALPATGGVPEATRYTWNLDVDPTPHEVSEDGSNPDLKGFDLDGKFTNWSRGACDPTAGTCPPPRDPGLQPFVLRGDCRKDNTLPVTLTLCTEKAKVKGVFDQATDTISVTVPTSALGLEPCGAVLGGAGTFGGSISAAPSAFLTSSNMPLDTMTVDGVYRAPSATDQACPEIPVLVEE